MFLSQIEKNRKFAFEHIVRVRKRQDENTVQVEGNVYSYTTKRGKIKKYIAFNGYNEYKHSQYYPQKAESCDGFWFVEVKM